MNIISSAIKGSLFALAAGLLFTTAAHGQARISGRVIDAQNKPMPRIEVLLASVTDSMGHDVDRDTSRADGTFEVTVPNLNPNAVYFVAVRHKGEVYIGELMRPPFPAGQEYVVQVGVNPIDLGAATGAAEAPPPPSKQERTAGLVVVLVAAAAIGSILYLTMRRRPPARRRWLVELARLEDELAAQPDNEALRDRRAELRARLTARTR